MAAEKTGANTKYRFSQPLFGNGDPTFYNVLSESKRYVAKKPGDTITKQWIVKDFKIDGSEENSRKKYYGLIHRGVAESFMQRIFRKMDPEEYTPKTKFIRSANATPGFYNLMIASRLYPLGYNKEFIPNIMSEYSLYGIHKSEADYFPGLLRSIIQRIIIEDWDNKLANYTSYPSKIPNERHVRIFDLFFALGVDKLSKKWTQEEIELIILGKKTASGIDSVAEALAETIGELGTRTHSYYYNSRVSSGIYFSADTRKNVKQKIVNSLKAELSAINPDHSLALISEFKKILKQMRDFTPVSYEKSLEDIITKFNDPKGFFENMHNVVKNLLIERLDKFEKYVENIAQGYKPSKEHITENAPEVASAKQDRPIAKDFQELMLQAKQGRGI